MKGYSRFSLFTLILFSLPLLSAQGQRLIPQNSQVNELIFPSRKIKVGKELLTVEIADTEPRQLRGLMFRENLPPNTGMLFIYTEEKHLNFWMKNTRIPLSIAFFNEKRELVEIQAMSVDPEEATDDDRRRYRSKNRAKYALEMPLGWFDRRGIEVGKKNISFAFVD